MTARNMKLESLRQQLAAAKADAIDVGGMRDQLAALEHSQVSCGWAAPAAPDRGPVALRSP